MIHLKKNNTKKNYWKKIKIELEQREFKVYYINQSLTTESIVKRYIDRYGNDYIRNKQNFEYYLKKINCQQTHVVQIKFE